MGFLIRLPLVGSLSARLPRKARSRAPRSLAERAPALPMVPTRSLWRCYRVRGMHLRGLGFPFTLTARAENHLRGNPDLDDTIARLRAYKEAGADVLYAPGLRTASEIRAICEAVSRPVNVVARAGMTLREIVDAGAQRISVGGGLTWVGVRAMAAAAEQMRDDGDFSALTGPGPVKEWLQAR